MGTRTREALPPRSGPDPSPARIIEGHCCGGLPSIFSSEPPRGCTGRRLPVQGEPVPLHPAPATLGLVRGRLLNLLRYIRVAAAGVHRGVRIGQAHKLPRERGVTRAASAGTLAGDRSVSTRPARPGPRRPSPQATFAGKPAPPLPTAARPTQTRGRSLLIFPSPSPPRPQPPRRPGFPGPTTTWPKAARALPAPPPCPPTAFISSIFALQVRS